MNLQMGGEQHFTSTYFRGYSSIVRKTLTGTDIKIRFVRA